MPSSGPARAPLIVDVGQRRQAESERENGCESCRNASTQSHWIPPGWTYDIIVHFLTLMPLGRWISAGAE